jgi:hypothetical protein
LGIGAGCNCQCNGGAAHADSGRSGGKLFGVIDYGLGGGDGGRFDAGNGGGGYTEFVHYIAKISGILGFTENAADAGNEGSCMLWLYWPLALVSSVSFTMLERTCSSVFAWVVKHVSAMVGHVGEKKLDNYRRATNQHDSHGQICYLVL